MPVYSCVLYLHPQAGRNDPGYYAYEWHGCRYVIQYKVIRLGEIAGGPILESQIPGLLPFTPLMRPPAGMDANRWFEACVEATVSCEVDADSRINLLAALGIFGSLVYTFEFIEQILPGVLCEKHRLFNTIWKWLRHKVLNKARRKCIGKSKSGIDAGEQQEARGEKFTEPPPTQSNNS